MKPTHANVYKHAMLSLRDIFPQFVQFIHRLCKCLAAAVLDYNVCVNFSLPLTPDLGSVMQSLMVDNLDIDNVITSVKELDTSMV